MVDPGITVPQDGKDLTISQDGIVSCTVPGSSTPQELGQLELSTFINPGGLTALGNNLMQQSAVSGQPQRARPGDQGVGTLQQGYLESANVKAVEEMIEMISTQRAYELNSKVIQTADQMLQRLTQLR